MSSRFHWRKFKIWCTSLLSYCFDHCMAIANFFQVALVQFSSSANTPLNIKTEDCYSDQMAFATPEVKGHLGDFVKDITAEGITNYGAGLDLAFQILRKVPNSERSKNKPFFPPWYNTIIWIFLNVSSTFKFDKQLIVKFWKTILATWILVTLINILTCLLRKRRHCGHQKDTHWLIFSHTVCFYHYYLTASHLPQWINAYKGLCGLYLL